MAALMNMLRRSTSPDADLAGFEEEEADASTPGARRRRRRAEDAQVRALVAGDGQGKRVPLSPVQNLQKRASPAKAAAPQELPAFTDAQRAAAKEKRRRRRTTGFTAADVESAPARVGDLHIPAFDPSTPKGKKKTKKRTPPRDPNATPPEFSRSLDDVNDALVAAVSAMMAAFALDYGNAHEFEAVVEGLSAEAGAHPGRVARDVAEKEQWILDETADRGPAAVALRALRRLVPADIWDEGASAEDLEARGLPRALARRVAGTRALWLCRRHPDDVAKLHAATLVQACATITLDLFEARAAGLSLAGIFGVPQSPEEMQLKPKESAEIGEPTPSKDDDAAAAPVVSESSDIAEPTPRKEPAAEPAPAAAEPAAPRPPCRRRRSTAPRSRSTAPRSRSTPRPAGRRRPRRRARGRVLHAGFAEVVDTEPEPVAEAPEVAEAPAAPEPEVAAAPAAPEPVVEAPAAPAPEVAAAPAAALRSAEAVGPTPAKAPSPAAVSFTPGFGDLGGAEPAEELPPAGAVALPAPAAPAPARKRASDAWWQKKVEAAAKSRWRLARAPAASGLAASLAEALKTPHPAEKRPAPRAAAAPAPVACDDPALAEFFAAATLTAYAAGVLTVAESIHDLEEMTDADVDDLAADIKLPKLKSTASTRHLVETQPPASSLAVR
ncbi:hypothetical protein JL720_1714 [Aureococcus anophagefferens]|nr:hypothetical protein JL720_1714 [Aureococcus anophagefferens]